MAHFISLQVVSAIIKDTGKVVIDEKTFNVDQIAYVGLPTESTLESIDNYSQIVMSTREAFIVDCEYTQLINILREKIDAK